MDSNTIYDLLTSQFLISFFFSFIGAFLSEVGKNLNRKNKRPFLKFVFELLSSTMIGMSVSVFLTETVFSSNLTIMISTSTILGFIGHKKALIVLDKKEK